MRENLILLGFDMKTIGITVDEPTDPSVTGLHINPLEFLAVILNLWIALNIISTANLSPLDYIIDLLSDNTTALSWMHVAATTPNPDLQRLARFASAILVQAACLLTRVQPLPVCEMSALPPADQAAINDSVSAFVTQDRGHIRLGNDGSSDSSLFFLPAGSTACTLRSSLQPS
jgi:hypothetical protein